MLFREATIYINGEAHAFPAPALRPLSKLADHRRLASLGRVDRDTRQRLYQWYRAGYLRIGDE
jgi:hypothetical protein